LLIQNEIPKEDLDYILEPFKEDKEEDNKQIISEKIIAIVRDAKGNIIDKREQKMRSLTQYYLALMSIPILGTYSGATGNTATSILVNVLGLPSNQSVYGGATSEIPFDTSIQLGSGTQSFSLTLNSLSAPILNGTGTGKLIYYSQSVLYTNNSISQILTVSNSSGNTITVSEIGLMGTIYLVYINSSFVATVQPYNFLFSYDTFSSPISIPNGGSASFQIIITFSG
jgi:hypothetical protein